MTHKFKSGREMLETIQANHDLYNKELKVYVFLYNEEGGIAVYNKITPETARQLNKDMLEAGERYWGSMLGVGGFIYDNNDEAEVDALKWCEDHFAILPEYSEWTVVTPHDLLVEDEDVNRLKEYMHDNFTLEGVSSRLVDNIIEHVAGENASDEELLWLDTLDALLDGTGITKDEILNAIMDIPEKK